MMNKNPKQAGNDNFRLILDKFSNKNLNVVLCSEPFAKSHFLNELIDSIDFSVIFLDFDLLYTGYIVAKMIPQNNRVKIYQPEIDNIEKIVSETVKKISEKKILVVIDSFNGFYNLFTELESGIRINAITMLLTSIARQTDSIIVVSAIARNKESGSWVLSPSGRRILKSKNMRIYNVKYDKNTFVLTTMN